MNKETAVGLLKRILAHRHTARKPRGKLLRTTGSLTRDTAGFVHQLSAVELQTPKTSCQCYPVPPHEMQFKKKYKDAIKLFLSIPRTPSVVLRKPQILEGGVVAIAKDVAFAPDASHRKLSGICQFRHRGANASWLGDAKRMKDTHFALAECSLCLSCIVA